MKRLTLLLAGALAGCGDESHDSAPARGSGAPLPIRGEVFFQGDHLGAPLDIALVGRHLVVVDPLGENAIHVVRTADGELVRSFGRKGEGPGEFRSPWSVDPAAGEENAFWVYDAGLGRLTHVDLDTDFREPTAMGRRSVTLRSEAMLTSPAWVSDSLVVSPGLLAEGRLAYLGPDGGMRRVVGQVPPGGEDVPPTVRQHAYQSTLRPSPDRSRLVLATRHADQLEIYLADGTPVARVKGPADFEPVFAVRQRGGRPEMASGADLRFGYVDVATSGESIFALYSGRTRGEYPGEANFGEFVHVYGWDGKLRRTLRLDAAVIAIAVDDRSGILYAARHDPTPAVLRYRPDEALPSP